MKLFTVLSVLALQALAILAAPTEEVVKKDVGRFQNFSPYVLELTHDITDHQLARSLQSGSQ